MAKFLIDDLRSWVLAAAQSGVSPRSAAARFGVGISTSIRWIAQAGQIRLTATKQGRRGGSRRDTHEDFILGMVVAHKDITPNEIVQRLSDVESVSIDRSAVDVWLRKCSLSYKKRPHMHWSRNAQI